MQLCRLTRLLATGALCCLPAADSRTDPSLVIADASEFIHEIPRTNTISDAAWLRVPWVFNNLAMALNSPEDAVATVELKQAGKYRLFVRSHGSEASSFRVSVNGRTDAARFGNAPMSWQRGDVYALEAGRVELRLTEISPAPVVDAIVLTTRETISDADLQPLEFPEEAELRKEYTIPPASAVKFGDVNGDGKADFLVLTRSYSAHMFDHEGKELWRWEAPAEGARLRGEFEAPGSIWDFDGDGFAEAVHWRMIEGKEYLVMADGRTGKVKRQVEWPTTPLPHVYNNFRTAIARLRPGYPEHVVVLTDSGGTISVTAYTKELKQLWLHVEHRKKDHLGHYVYPVDLDGDGVDEVVVSHLALSADGKVLWDRFDLFPDHHDHVDSFKFADITGDGQLEALGATSDAGVVVFKARTGEILWKHPAHHSQQIQFGHFLKDAPGPQVIVGARIYGDRRRGEPYLWGEVHWFDPKGVLLRKWPRNPINGNPDFVKGDWRGDGSEELFWFKFRLEADGRGRLYFADPVYHMFDFLGNGAEQVITLRGPSLKVYGRRGVKPRRVERDADYLRHSVANHTHY